MLQDGGLDISEDGEFLLACAILPGHNRACGMDLSNLDAMDSYAQIHEYKYHTGRLSVDEDAEYGGGVDVETTFSDRMAYAYNKRSFEELILTNPPSPDAAGTTTNMSTDTTGSSENGTFSQFGASLDGVVLSHSANLDGNSASTACNGENEEENSRIDSDANMRPRSAVAHLNTRRFPGLMDPQHTSNSTNGGMVSNPMLTSLPAPPMFQCKGSAFSNRGFLPKGGKSNGQKSIFNETQHYSDKVEDYLCLFKLVNIKTHSHCKDQSPSESGYKRHGLDGFSGSNTVATSPTQHQMSFKISPIIPVLQSAKPLPDNLMRAITSAKLSPSKQYCLLGFGVRTEGVVFGHFAS